MPRHKPHPAYQLAVVENHHKRDARLLHDGGHGAGGVGECDTIIEHGRMLANGVPTGRCTNGHGSTNDPCLTNYAGSNPVPSTDTWEDARQRNASQRGYEYVPPNSLPPGTVVRSQPDTDCLRTDAELARIAMALKLSILFRLWLILHEMARLTGRQGFTQDELDAALIRYHVKHSETKLTRYIPQGHRLFWELDGNTGMVYPVGYVTLALRLVKRAYAFDFWDIFITNIAGRTKDMYLNVSGSLGDFEAQILAGWHASKNNPTISRFVLTNLFNRDVRTMRKLERRAGIKTVRNVAHTYDPSLVPLDADGGLRWDVETYQDRAGRTVYAFTMSNTYHAPHVRQHNAWGQNRRARAVIDKLMETFELPSSGRGTAQAGKLNPDRTRQYFETAKSARGNFKKFGDQPRHIPLGADDGNTVHWELSLNGQSDMDFWAASDGIRDITPMYKTCYEGIQNQPF